MRSSNRGEETKVKDFGKLVCEAVKSGTLVEPFNAVMIRTACPGWEDRIYHIVLSEHTAGNGCESELFERVSFGLYRLIRTPSESIVKDESVAVEQLDSHS
jgi:hypothetical protein